MFGVIRGLIKTLLVKVGFGIFRIRNHYYQDGVWTVHSHAFRTDPAFRQAYQRGIQASHGIDPHLEWRVHVALWAARAALQAKGDFVECGVNAGFVSSAILHGLQWDQVGRRFYLIDTFNGPVFTQFSPDEKDQQGAARRALERGAYVTDVDRVRTNFAEWRNAIVVQGAVPEILQTMPVSTVAFLHLDMNCAYPERAALEFFWDRLTPGAIVLLDDYTYYGHDSQRREIQAAARAKGAEVLSLPTGQGMILR